MKPVINRRFIAIICAFAVIFAFDFSLNSSASPLPAVLEKNLEVIGNVKDYGPEFVMDYIVENGTEEEYKAILNEVQVLSDSLTDGITDDYEKLRVIAEYVSGTISYDHDAAHNDVSFDTICLKNVMERKRTTCAGFSNFFSALTQAQGFYCVNIRGSSPEAALGITYSNLGDENTPINHEWTAVWYEAEQRWIYIDCTWNSLNSYENGEFSLRKPVSTYFDMSIESFSRAHKANTAVFRNFFEVLELYQETSVTTASSVSKTNTAAVATSTKSTSKPSVSKNNTSASEGLKSEISMSFKTSDESSDTQITAQITDAADTESSLQSSVSDIKTTSAPEITAAQGVLVSDKSGTLYSSSFSSYDTSTTYKPEYSTDDGFESSLKKAVVFAVICVALLCLGAVLVYKQQQKKDNSNNEDADINNDDSNNNIFQ